MFKNFSIIMLMLVLFIFSSCSMKTSNSDAQMDTKNVDGTNVEQTKTVDTQNINKIKKSTLDKKSGFLCITYGKYKNEDLEWLIIDKNDDGVLLLSKNIIDCKNYNEENVDVVWDSSSLRDWLNTTFVENVSDINTSVFYNLNKFDGKINVNDTVSLLSIALCRKYFGVEDENKQNVKLAAKATKYAKDMGVEVDTHKGTDFYDCGSFFLIDNGETKSKAAWVGMYGRVYEKGQNVKLNIGDGIRPIIALKSEAFENSLIDSINNNLFSASKKIETTTIKEESTATTIATEVENTSEETSVSTNESTNTENKNYTYTNIRSDKYKSTNAPLTEKDVIDLSNWKYGTTPIEWVYVEPNVQLISNTRPNMSQKFGYKQSATSGSSGCYVMVYTNCDEVKGADFDGRMFVIDDNNSEKYPLDTIRFKNSFADLEYKNYNVLELLKKQYEMIDISDGIYMAGDVYVNVIYLDILDKIIENQNN